MNRDELIEYLGRLGYGTVSARGITALADTATAGVDLGADGTVCRSSRPGRYLVVGGGPAIDPDTDHVERLAKCAS
jgi:hypothetical protein